MTRILRELRQLFPRKPTDYFVSAGKKTARFRCYAPHMDDIILCGLSAFQYYRTPPQVLGLYPAIAWPKGRHEALSKQPLSADVFGGSITRLVFDRASRTGAKSIRPCLWQGDLPLGHIRETDHGFCVVSPELALFQMASRISKVHLAMAAMEACGWFSVFKPSDAVEDALASNAVHSPFLASCWRRSISMSGANSNLWQREPLTDVSKLRELVPFLKGKRGSVSYAEAVDMVTGVVASPFEAQASLLFSLPRKMGGEGFPCFENNSEVRMSTSARLVSGMSKCYVDLLFPGKDKESSIAVECQGRSAHGASGVSLTDANRMLALETMGIEVLPLTYEQILDADRFRAVASSLAGKMGISYKPKTMKQLDAERNLRSQLFVDWLQIGNSGLEPRF